MPFFLISIALHLTSLFLIGQSSKPQKNLPPSSSNQPITIRIHTPGSSKQKGESKSPKSSKSLGSGEECKDYYYGIGITTDNRLSNEKGCEVTGVAPFGPASEANLEVGDIIVALDGGCIFRGAKDTLVIFQLIKKHSGETKLLTLTRKKICTNKPD